MNRVRFWMAQIVASIGIFAVGALTILLLFTGILIMAVLGVIAAIGCLGYISVLVAMARLRIDEAEEILREAFESDKVSRRRNP